MSKVKAHIVIEDKIDQPAGRTKLLNKLKRTAKIADVNEKRYETFGVLTATLDDSQLEKVRKTPGVAAVELDQERQLQ